MSGISGLRIGVLGPLTVTRDGTALGLPRGRAAVMLAVLAMFTGHSVSAARLARLIWAEEQPVRVRASLQTLAARLRAEMPGVIVTSGDGYLLDLDPDHVDLLLFRRLIRAANQAADAAAAVDLLDQALQLWRGEPLAGLRSAALEHELVPGLTDELLSAVQQRAELDLAAGRHDRVIAELRGMTAEHPLREPLWEQLLRALIAAARPAEAISEYHRAREILAAELGVDPSPGLQEVYQQLLHGAGHPPAHPVPGSAAAPDHWSAASALHRLPADTRVFTGRLAELRRLIGLGEAADGSAGPGAVAITAIDGMAGIGKTALAVHAAHRLAGHFGDGQLFIDLHGHTQGYPPRSVGEALETLLRTLGVPAQQIPEDAEERAALYRARLAGTRTLIVLDNAADETQVRSLIPGADGCLVLVTSRRKLKGLDDAHTVALGLPPEPEAITLFCAVAGPGRVAAGDPALAEIASLCGHLPLAVRIAASLLRNRPAWSLEHLMGRLHCARTGLDALADGDRGIAAVFDLSSQALHEDQRHLYRHLGLIPGPDIDAHAAAALLDTEAAIAERLLQELVDHNLLSEPARGRYCMHDLIRSHSRALAMLGQAGEREAALGRLLDYYLQTAQRADAQIARYPQPGPAVPAPASGPALPDADTARAWLRAERASLIAGVHHAMQAGDDGRTVGLLAGLASLLRTDGPWPQAIRLHTAAGAAAGRLGDRSGQARALTELGDLRRLTGDYPGADRDLGAALRLWQEVGSKAGQVRALTELGAVRRLSGDYPGADRDLGAALRLWQELGSKAGQIRTLTEMGSAGVFSGDWTAAERNLQAALELCRETGDRSGQAYALTEIASVQRVAGNYPVAIQNAKAALAICEELGDRLGQANALTRQGELLLFTGDYDGAAWHLQAALEVYQELGDPLGQANTRTRLGEVRRLTGDYASAARKLEEAIQAFRELGHRGNQAVALNLYAATVSDAGDLRRANTLYRDALRLAQLVHHPDDEAAALEGLGDNHLRSGKPHDGAVYLRRALEIYQRLGMPAADQVTARLAKIGSN